MARVEAKEVPRNYTSLLTGFELDLISTNPTHIINLKWLPVDLITVQLVYVRHCTGIPEVGFQMIVRPALITPKEVEVQQKKAPVIKGQVKEHHAKIASIS